MLASLAISSLSLTSSSFRRSVFVASASVGSWRSPDSAGSRCPAVTRLRRFTANLSAAPGRLACPLRASGWSSLTTPWGFPCCVRFPCAHAAANTPVQRLGVLFAHSTPPYQPSPIWQSGRPTHRPFRGLLGVHSRCGLHTRAVTNSCHANRRLQPLRGLHYCSDRFRLERLPDGPLHPLKSAAFSRRTPQADSGAGARPLLAAPAAPQSLGRALAKVMTIVHGEMAGVAEAAFERNRGH